MQDTAVNQQELAKFWQEIPQDIETRFTAVRHAVHERNGSSHEFQNQELQVEVCLTSDLSMFLSESLLDWSCKGVDPIQLVRSLSTVRENTPAMPQSPSNPEQVPMAYGHQITPCPLLGLSVLVQQNNVLMNSRTSQTGKACGNQPKT